MFIEGVAPPIFSPRRKLPSQPWTVTGALLFSLENYIAQSGVSHIPVKLLVALKSGLQCFRMQNPLALMFPVKAEGERHRPLGASVRSSPIAEAAQGRGWSSETTVDQTLIRGLGTAFRVFVSGLSSV